MKTFQEYMENMNEGMNEGIYSDKNYIKNKYITIPVSKIIAEELKIYDKKKFGQVARFDHSTVDWKSQYSSQDHLLHITFTCIAEEVEADKYYEILTYTGTIIINPITEEITQDISSYSK